MKLKYEVIEERGCSIEYSIFNGTRKECQDFIVEILNLQNIAYRDKVDYDSYFNGNGEAFTYRIK